MTRVPLLDLLPQNHALASELRDAFDRVLGHGHFILGQEVTEFEEAAARELGAKHAIGVSSGTDALLLALMTLGIGPGDEVIVPSFSFFATAGAVARVGARPVFADICPHCFNLDPEHAAQVITEKTRAIIPVHLFGQAAPMEPLMGLAHQQKLHVIEDAAQAFGATWQGRALGTLGDFGCFSFFPSKNLGGFGDGGLLVTGDDELAAKARVLRVHGAEPKYHHSLIGGNFRLDALQAALLKVKLPHHTQYSRQRAEHAAYYREALAPLAGQRFSACAHCPGTFEAPSPEGPKLALPEPLPGNTHIWNQFTLRLPVASGDEQLPRDRLKAWLAKRQIGSEIYYPVPLHRQACFAGLGSADCPEADRTAREVLSVPVYPEMNAPQRETVATAIREFFEA